MTTVRKYSFGTEFDAPIGEGARGRSFAEAEVAAEKARAFAEGEGAGRRAADATIEAAAARALERILAAVEAQHARLAGAADEARRTVLEVAVAICRKVLPALADRGAAEEIARLVSATLAGLAAEPRVVVRVAPALVEPLTARLNAAEAGFAGKLVLLGDEAIAAGNCTVLWAEGGVERDGDRLLSAIDAAVARHLALPAPLPAAADPAAPEPAKSQSRIVPGGST